MLSEFVARAEGEASAEHRRATALENLVFNAAGHCIVTTGAMKEKVVGYGVPEERVSVIPNYVDTMLFRPLEGQEGGKASIGFIGRLSAQKNPLLPHEALDGPELAVEQVGDA